MAIDLLGSELEFKDLHFNFQRESLSLVPPDANASNTTKNVSIQWFTLKYFATFQLALNKLYHTDIALKNLYHTGIALKNRYHTDIALSNLYHTDMLSTEFKDARTVQLLYTKFTTDDHYRFNRILFCWNEYF